MKRHVALLALLLLSPLDSAAEPCGKGQANCIIYEGRAGTYYGWMISASASDPFVHKVAATGGLATYYLWFYCVGFTQGLSAAEFDVVASGPIHVATIPVNGFLNAGGVTNLLLAVGGCPSGPVVAANLLVIDNPGSLCLAPSAQNGVKGAVDCTTVPQLWPIEWIGVEILPTTAVESESWGEVKQRYR